MGGGSSRPSAPAPPTVTEDPYPGGEGRVDSISLSSAQGCSKCTLEMAPAISSSSVKLTRNFGDTNPQECRKFDDDLKRVRAKEFSFQDFMANLQAGKYLRPTSTDFCEQIKFSEEDLADLNKAGGRIEDFDSRASKLKTVRIRKVSTGGFSSDTKAQITPSIPFKMYFNGEEILIKTMTLYHPCPLRIEANQADAVLSLNDPSDKTAKHVILIPLVSGNLASSSADFIGKIGPQIATIATPDPSTGRYLSRDVQTGADWTLSKLFPITNVKDNKFAVPSGFFVWEGAGAMEKYISTNTPSLVNYSWRQAGTRGPKYILLEKPLPISPTDLATITQNLPVTPAFDAIHPVMTPVLYKQGPPENCGVPMREKFTSADLQTMADTVSCDPFLNNMTGAPEKRYSTDVIVGIIFKFLLFCAAAIGAYIALAAVARMYDVEFKDFAEATGKVTAVWMKDLKGMSNLGGLMSMKMGKGGPMAARGSNPVTAQSNSMAALGNVQSNSMAALGNIQGSPLGNVRQNQLGNVGSSAITNLLPSGPIPQIADAIAPAPAPAPVPSPAPRKKWRTVDTSGYTGTRSSRGDKGLVNRGGTLRRGRGRDA
jgi:hypothetical protein